MMEPTETADLNGEGTAVPNEKEISELKLDDENDVAEESVLKETIDGKSADVDTDKNDVVVSRDKESTTPAKITPVIQLRNMLEDIEEGELDYDEEEEEDFEDLPDLPEYDPNANKKPAGSEDGEIMSDNNDEREDGEIRDDDETGQVYVCVDPLHDKWKKVSKNEKHLFEVEEGQIVDSEETQKPTINNQAGRFIPRTLCKYFNNGLCRWGSTCHFLHPGINDKGILMDVPPTWNATAGNYAMHRPPGMYPNAFGKAPPPMECINRTVMPTPNSLKIQDYQMGPIVELYEPPRKETAWEKGLRKAKEVKEAAARCREKDKDFEEKRLGLRIPEHHGENEDDEQNADRYERHPKDEHRSDRYDDRYSRKEDAYNNERNRSVNLDDLHPFHPIRREERQRQREREMREEKEREKHEKTNLYQQAIPEEKAPVADPRLHSSYDPPPKQKVNTTEWHDPWMRKQYIPQRSSDQSKHDGLEAISDSESSSSDSDSNSGSSTDSDSSSPSSINENKRPRTIDGRRVDNVDVKNHDPRHRHRESRTKLNKHQTNNLLQKNEMLSHDEWKQLQSLQKAQNQQQVPHPSRYAREKKRDYLHSNNNNSKEDVHQQNKDDMAPRINNELQRISQGGHRKRPPSIQNRLQGKDRPVAAGEVVKNDDKFDSPKRKTEASGTDSESDSDSDSESDSDSSDTDDDSDSDSDANFSTTVNQAVALTRQPFNKTQANDGLRRDLNVVKGPPTLPVAPATGVKRPVRKDELLKELKAVEDAIARKRAKID